MVTQPNTSAPAQPEARPRLSKRLPTFRVGFPKQLDALRAYAVLSENGTKPVHYARIGEIIKVHESNVSSMNPFFLENGFVEKQGAAYTPTAPVLEYNRQYSWNPETAPQKLAPIINNSWFGQALSHRLQFRPMSEEDAIEALASICSAGPESKPQLRVLVEYCEVAGVLVRENGQLTLTASAPHESNYGQKTPQELQPMEAQIDRPTSTKPALAPVSASQEGGVNFNISVQISMAEMKDWSADRIGALFSGIAQVLAAKHKDT